MERDESYKITKEQYNYLLPTELKPKLLCRNAGGKEYHYFIGTFEGYKDVLNRCKYL